MSRNFQDADQFRFFKPRSGTEHSQGSALWRLLWNRFIERATQRVFSFAQTNITMSGNWNLTQPRWGCYC